MEKNSKREKNIKLSELFYKCAFEGGWQTVNDVDFKFVEQGDTLQIYFMGSYQTTDWIRNFLFFKKPYKDMKIPYYVHGGFLKAWKEVEDVILNKILELDPTSSCYKWKHIVVVGYSHGGALSAFATEAIWFHRPDLRDTGLEGYGFEAHRIYRGFKVKKELQERWANFRVIRCNNDLVTHCPPSFLCFTHVNKDYIRIKGDINLAPKKWYIPNCIKSHYPQVVYDGLKKYEEANK